MRQCQCNLSAETRIYLEKYNRILNNMIKAMEGGRLKDSISYNFIVQMIPHHMAAIEMSENLLCYDPIPALGNIAEGIITEQTKSIADMAAIEEDCEMCRNTAGELREFQNRINRIKQFMFSQMRQACADDFISCDFMREMIPHHMGAVRMSEVTLGYSVCQGLVPILEAIISSQKKGIWQMQNLIRQNC